MSVSNEDVLVIVDKIQQAIDDSCFIGKAFIEEDEPFVICALMQKEVVNEPGACGAYPFYQSKCWLTDKVEEFLSSRIDEILDNWGEYDCLREHFIEAVDIADDGDECRLLFSYRLA